MRGSTSMPGDRRLERAEGLQIELGPVGHPVLVRDGRRYDLGRRALALLDAFAEPRRLDEALAQVAARSHEAWVEAVECALHLIDLGILVEDGGERVRPSSGWASPGPHIAMLQDRARTAGYLDAIAQVVRPGDVVVDIGTGTGILALAAARAGARRVYALEASGMAAAAEQMAKANDVADTVQVVRGWSTDIELPERADVLITETIGNDPLGERIDTLVRDARRRLLVPDAREIPRRLTHGLLGVTVPDEVVAKHRFTEQRTAAWQAQYGFDFAPLLHQPASASQYVDPYEARTWPALTPSLCFDEGVSEQRTQAVTAGVLTGFVLGFEAELAEGISISTLPGRVEKANHWSCRLLPVDPVSVRPGEPLRVTFERSDSPRVRVHGDEA